jgi:hypothetical protein
MSENKLLDAFKRFVEYIIVSAVTFKDNPMLTSTIHALLFVLYVQILSPKWIYALYRYFNKNNINAYYHIDMTNYKICFWELGIDKEFDSNVFGYLSSKIKNKKTHPHQYHPRVKKIVNRNITEYSLKSLEIGKDDCIPIYLHEGNAIYAALCAEGYISFMYEDEKTLYKFLDIFHRSNKESYNTSLCIYNNSIFDANDMPIRSPLYSNYTFDYYISDGIDVIIKAIEEFKRVNSPDTPHMLQNRYNLGIMLYGVPGTGKTLLMKTICCELQRSARMFKLHKLKTTTDLIENIDKCVRDKEVIILDEFDFDSTLISRGNSNYKQQIQQLIDRKTQLLKANTSDELKEELKDINKAISKLDDKLDISSLLTTLDGMHEHRGRVIIACTNKIKDIDEALLRPGRFDIVLELKPYSYSEILRYLSVYYNRPVSNLETELEKITPAELNNLCSLHSFESLIDILNSNQKH